MKNVLWLWFLLAMCISCTADEEVQQPKFPIESFVGSWAYETVSIAGETGYYPHRDACYKDHFQIYHEEGKWNQYYETIYLNDDCANSGTSLEWKINGDMLSLYFGEQFVAVYKILSVSRSTFSLLYQVDVDEDGKKDDVILNAVWYDPFERFPR